MKRKTIFCLICTVLVVGMLSLAGCGNADQDAISKDLTSQLDSLQSSGSQALTKELKANESTFTALGIDTDELAKSILDGFTYNIGTITIKDGAKSATADVELTSKTANTILTSLVNTLPSAAANITANDIATEDSLNKFIGKQLTEAVNKAGTEKATLTVTYSKNGDTWKLDDLETQLYKALGLDELKLEDIYKQLGVSNYQELENYIKQYIK